VDHVVVEMPEISLTSIFFLVIGVFGIGFSLWWLMRVAGFSLREHIPIKIHVSLKKKSHEDG
jgi:hypothetical protein